MRTMNPVQVQENEKEDDEEKHGPGPAINSPGAKKVSVPFFANLVYSSPHRND